MIELLPPGPDIEGRDGRAWIMDDPEAVAARSLEGGREIPIDWEHASEIKAPKGEPAPAAGWIVALEVRDGAIWGKVEWTERGAAAVAAREYRYISPVFSHEKDSEKIIKLLSAALTNSPNLRLTALNREDPSRARERYKESPMDDDKKKDMAAEGAMMCPAKIAEALGMAVGATVDEALNMIAEIKKMPEVKDAMQRTQAPSLDKYVPRGDYDAACSRARNAETKLAGIRAEALDHEIETALAGALEAGKITPATEDYHRAQCRLEGGLKRFEKFVESAPEIAGASGIDRKKPNATKPAARNAEQRKIDDAFGNSADDLAKHAA